MRPALALGAVCAALTAAPVLAQDGCDDLWFTRNLVFDRAGYCFGSTLGQAVFDNADCTGSSVTLPARGERVVNEVRRLEGVFSCDVDTSRRTLSPGDWEIRRQLAELPIRDEFESACLGYMGAPVPLHAAPDSGSIVVGSIDPGDTVGFAHYGLDGGVYVTSHRESGAAPHSGGWLLQAIGDNDCVQWAG